MLGRRLHAGIHEHEVEGVGIVISLHEAGKAILHCPVVPPVFTKAPAQLYAAVLSHDAALSGFAGAGPVHVPAVSDALEGRAVLIHLQVAHSHGAKVTDGKIPLGSPRHLNVPLLGDRGAAIFADDNADVYILYLLGPKRETQQHGTKCRHKAFHTRLWDNPSWTCPLPGTPSSKIQGYRPQVMWGTPSPVGCSG